MVLRATARGDTSPDELYRRVQPHGRAHPARLEALPAWWHRHARGESVEFASRLRIEEPRYEPLGVWRMGGSLRSPWRLRSIPVELWLWPHLDAWTKLALEPQRDVHVGHRYFSAGQRVLDALCSRLMRELDTDL